MFYLKLSRTEYFIANMMWSFKLLAFLPVVAQNQASVQKNVLFTDQFIKA